MSYSTGTVMAWAGLLVLLFGSATNGQEAPKGKFKTAVEKPEDEHARKRYEKGLLAKEDAKFNASVSALARNHMPHALPALASAAVRCEKDNPKRWMGLIIHIGRQHKHITDPPEVLVRSYARMIEKRASPGLWYNQRLETLRNAGWTCLRGKKAEIMLSALRKVRDDEDESIELTTAAARAIGTIEAAIKKAAK